ncbi:basic salivary proline-rich protein 1-like isoform X2 [Crotalus tigris]|uniref:basic salivary proline-rich protein 1-like isoform X2 n=1 Tax=Crotalus tigris TaxID=88082 RepID=UPI00192F1E78|nr:basic salivary proline-rich protein 1-like isoform X2 [Crotalus tigris]
MVLSFVAAALLISVLSTEAQNNIPNPPPPPPGYPDSQSYNVPTNYNTQVSDPKPGSFPASAQVSYSGPPNNIPNPPPPPPGYPDSQSYNVPTNYNTQVSDPKLDNFPGSAQVSYSGPPGNPGYSNNAHFGNPSPQYPPPPPWFPRNSGPPWFPRNFGPPDLHEFEKLLKFFERIMKAGWKKHWWRHHQHSGPPQYHPSPPHGYPGPSQSYAGQPQGYFNPPQVYLGQQPLSFPAQPSGSAVPPPSGTQQSNYGSPPNFVYNYHDSVPQQQLFPGQSLPATGADPSALPSPQYSAGPAPFVPPPSAPAASVSSGDVKVPGNSTLPDSGTPGNSS